MNRCLLLALSGALACPAAVPADQPPPAAEHDACQVPNNLILGPRTADRPLPLLSGDAAHGFHPACTVSWTTLSPKSEPLPVVGCYRGNLLQVANDAACGGGTGRLWVSIRWVLTTGERQAAQTRATTCQQLDTGSYAATRDYGCAPAGKAPAAASGAAPRTFPDSAPGPAAAAPPAATAPAAGTPHPEP